jgi:hypothetical protein
MRRYLLTTVLFATSAAAQRPASVPTSAPTAATEQNFRDTRFGVSFTVPPGWLFTRKDREVSTFRLDARSAPQRTQMRGVASLDFNPFPFSTLSGALVYFSVAQHSNENECARQAKNPDAPTDVQDIGGMNFVHGHDERGKMCVEARHDIYTAYRKGSCYRFDLQMNTFCAASSGAQEITDQQMRDIEERMTGILSTVTLNWQKTGPHLVAPPSVEQRRPLPSATPPVSTTQGGG